METAQLWYLFDQIMLVADEHDAFLVDLSGGLDSLEARGSSDLPATIKGIEGEVVIRMTESHAGNWRVNQMILPGGDEDSVPWAVP